MPSPRRAPGPAPRDLLRLLPIARDDTLAFLLELTRTWGDVTELGIPRVPVLVVNDPAAIQHVLRDHHRNYTKRTLQYDSLATITGRGLLTSDGEHWFRQRRLQQPAFSRARIEGLDRIVVPAVDAMLERWAPSAERGEAFDVDDEMMRLALEIVGQALFGIDLRRDAPALTRAVLTALDFIVHRARHPFAPPTWVPTPGNRRFGAALAALDRAVRELVAERRRRPPDDRDMLGLLLAARDPDDGRPMSDVELRDEILTLLIAGHETVASALTWTWLLLAQHPDAWERLRAEVCATLGDRPPASADLRQLDLVRATFSEALRLFPPAWVISRRAIAEDELGGWRVPAGALVVISPYTMHRHAAHWSEPESFRPERFVGDAGKARHRFAYLPFGGGPRICIGNEFALVEGALVLARVAQRFRLELEGMRPPRVEALVTLRPGGGLRVRAARA
ncbi:MAG: cytochrome P450 [Polyangiaceae bacterium]|nr:cytochrome P450 [Polyangiaceae bacterium]